MNNIEDVLHYVDDLISLTPIQEIILKGTYERKKHWEIANEYNCSESHIKGEARKLWQKLGQELGETINKHNVRSKLAKKYRVSQGDNSGYWVLNKVNGDINICEKSLQVTNNQQERSPSPQPQNQETIIDLKDLPELNCDDGRKLEIFTLKEWLKNNTRLITIYGLKGIGKTALVIKLISEINTEFDYIFYRSLDDLPKLITLKDELKKFFSQSQSNGLLEIIDYCKAFRSLIILDDVQNIFKRGELAGKYLIEYQDYRNFFEQIATKNHQSCLILINQEKSPDIEILENKSNHAETLQIQGLGESAKEIFQEKGLKNEEKWQELITLYQGHPTWLNIILSIIKQLYNGDVTEFLTEDNELFIGDIELYLQPHLERLSESESKVIQWLAVQNQPVNIAKMSANLEKSKAQLGAIIQSLLRRCLVEKSVIEEQYYYELNRIFKEYLKLN